MPKLVYKSKRFQTGARIVIAQANQILEEYAAQGYDLTLRQLYYQFVARGLLPNKQKEYDRLQGIVSDARLAGLIDWDHIVDRTRNRRGRYVWHRTGPADAIRHAASDYTTDLWADQDYRLEVWVEKDALVGVVQGACWDLDVPYFSCRGYTSQTEVWLAAQRLLTSIRDGYKVRILHLGDHDPSGIDMTRDIEERMFHFLVLDHWRWKMAGSGDNLDSSFEVIEKSFKVDRLALNWDQIELYDPPPNPAKLSDSRAASYVREYGNESWELDALPPDAMAELIRESVMAYADDDRWEQALENEATETELLKRVSDRWDEIKEMVA